MIVTVTIVGLWLNPVGDLSSGMYFDLNDIEYPDAVSVTVGQYAGGNYLPRTQKGKQRVSKVTLVNRGDTQAAQLQAWQGVLLCIRDARGRKMFGLYTDLDVHPSRMPNQWDATFTFTETTYSEST